MIETEMERVRKTFISGNEETRTFLENHNSTVTSSGTGLTELIRRPELDYDLLSPLDPDRPLLPRDVCEQVNIEIKYEGYIQRQRKQAGQMEKMEKYPVPADLDYKDVGSLRLEARQKLALIRPETIGQASRIAGVSPADVNVLYVYLQALNREPHQT